MPRGGFSCRHRLLQGRCFRLWDSLVDWGVEKEGFVLVNQDCMGLLSVFEKFSLVFFNVKLNLRSFLKRRDRSVNPIGLVDKRALRIIDRSTITHKHPLYSARSIVDETPSEIYGLA